jgi:hypothetical protein
LPFDLGPQSQHVGLGAHVAAKAGSGREIGARDAESILLEPAGNGCADRAGGARDHGHAPAHRHEPDAISAALDTTGRY